VHVRRERRARRGGDGVSCTCMKEGLLPANMHSRVKTKAARPKMTGMSAVGRSILGKCIQTPRFSRWQCGTGLLSKISASAGTQTIIRKEGEEKNKKQETKSTCL